ncbi:MAG: ABC-F family ATP-binding cassette domain-containing protein [Actinomycetota bacterium]|nr:ABC-F family ATP-binding cassette domain-containing protein [Actinomycetota bacterium]
MILVDLVDVGVSRPDRPLFEHLSVTVSSGDRLGIVGINGTGKSTLLGVLSGENEPEAGVVRRGQGVRIAALGQRPELGAGTVAEAMGDSWEAEAALDRVGMSAFADVDTGRLSGGQAKRAALARTLVTPCDLLILDEPTNHLDIDAIAWLEERLAGHRGGLVLVTHDRHLLDRVTNRILELDRGRAYTHDGGYASYLEARAERESRAAEAESVRRNLAKRELAWLRRGAPARTSKPKARIEAATAIVEGRAEAAAREGSLPLHFGTPRLGDVVVELEGVSMGHGDGPDLFAGVELRLDPRERLGIVGVNGVGKSTLLDLMARRTEPRTGSVTWGSTVQLGYYDQLGRDLDPSARVREVVAGPTRRPDHTDAALLERFWFDGDAQWAPVGTLSGGERRRLQLLVELAARPNVLLLDEPTNDLDVDTLRALEDFLDEWPGALVVVSHDRAFLERTVADVVVLDGTGTVARRPGGYAAWEDERRASRTKGRAATAGSVAEVAERAGGGSKGSGGSGGGRSSRERTGRSPSTLRHLTKQVESEMRRLERRREALTAELADVTDDHVALARIGGDIAAVEAELADAEERWLELAEEAESA